MNRNTHALALAGMTAALYVALTLLSSAIGLAFGPVQFRLSEALCVLPWLFPNTVWGLFAGCLVSNLLSPYGLLDLLLGSGATLLAALCTRKVKKRWLAPLPPVLWNMLLIGGELAWYEVGFSERFLPLFAINALWVGAGEAVVCFLLGGLLLRQLPKVPLLRRLLFLERKSKQKEL